MCALLPSLFCGVNSALPSSIIFIVSTQSFAPIPESLSKGFPLSHRFPHGQLPLLSYLRCLSLHPSLIMVTPVNSSPFITAHWIGAAPLYLGRSDACTFMQRVFWHIEVCSLAESARKSQQQLYQD